MMPVQLRFYQQNTAPGGQVTPLFRGSQAASIGAAVSGLGADLERGQREYDQKVERQQAQDASTMALRITAETRTAFANRLTELQENGEPGLPEFTRTVANEYQQYRDRALEGVPDWARQRVQNSLLAYGDTLSQQALGIETKARWQKRADDLEVGIEGSVLSVERAPGTYQQVREQTAALIEDSQLPPAMRAAAMDRLDKQLPVAYATGLLASNPSGMAGMFNSRFETSDPVLKDLPLQTRMSLKAKADNIVNSRMASARADLTVRQSDHLAAAYAGKPSSVKEITLPEFQAAHGGAEGAVRFAKYQQGLELANTVSAMPGMTNDQLAAVVEAAKAAIEGPGAAEAAKRADVIEKTAAAIERERRNAATAERQALATVMSEEMAAAMDGEEYDRLSLDAFIEAYPDVDQAQAKYRDWITALDALEMGRALPDMPAGEAFDAVSSRFASPFEVETWQKLIGEIAKLQQQRADDPAAAALSVSPTAQRYWQEYMQAGDLAVRNEAFGMYAETMREEQERLQIPSDQRRILPKNFVEGVKAQFAQAQSPEAVNGEQMMAIVQGLRNDAGAMWPEVAMELMASEAMPEIAIPIASGMAEGPSRLLMQNAGRPWADFHLETADQKNIDSALTSELADFRKTVNPMMGVNNGTGLYNTYRDAARRLAYVYTANGMTAVDAAEQAAQEVIAERYHFQDNYRVPKQAAVNAGGFDLIERGAEHFKETLLKERMLSVVGTDAAKQSVVESLVDGSVWITSPDERGLVLTYNGMAVEDADGQPVALPWSTLSDVGRAFFAETNWLERRFQ